MTQEEDQNIEDEDRAQDSRQRKERVIHTRVSVVLERELKQLAGSLRVPVSNVVRAILEDAVGKIDQVGRFAEGEIRSVADRLEKQREVLRTSAASAAGKTGSEAADRDDEPAAAASVAASDEPQGEDAPSEPSGASEQVGERPPAATDPLSGVVGFQPLLLARDERCAVCEQSIAAGKEAFVGIRDDGGPRVIVDRGCLPFSPD